MPTAATLRHASGWTAGQDQNRQEMTESTARHASGWTASGSSDGSGGGFESPSTVRRARSDSPEQTDTGGSGPIDMIGDALGGAGEAVSDPGGTVTDALGGAGEAVSDPIGTVTDALGGAGEAVSDPIGTAGDALGGDGFESPSTVRRARSGQTDTGGSGPIDMITSAIPNPFGGDGSGGSTGPTPTGPDQTAPGSGFTQWIQDRLPGPSDGSDQPAASGGRGLIDMIPIPGDTSGGPLAGFRAATDLFGSLAGPLSGALGPAVGTAGQVGGGMSGLLAALLGQDSGDDSPGLLARWGPAIAVGGAILAAILLLRDGGESDG